MDLLKVTYTPEINGWNPRPWFPNAKLSTMGMGFQWIHPATLIVLLKSTGGGFQPQKNSAKNKSWKWEMGGLEDEFSLQNV